MAHAEYTAASTYVGPPPGIDCNTLLGELVAHTLKVLQQSANAMNNLS